MKPTSNVIQIVKKTLPLLIIAAVVVSLSLGIFKFNKSTFTDQKEPEVKEAEKISVFEKALEPVYGEPIRITVPTVGIDVEVEPVGVADDGSLETPGTWKKAGWFERGANPGETGNLLINAHYDDNYGRPAAFWQLKNVGLGDTVTVVDTYGRRYGYKVTEYSLVSINDPNRTDVFKSDESAKITLITCGGVWIPGKATYDKRLVIKGELIR